MPYNAPSTIAALLGNPGYCCYPISSSSSHGACAAATAVSRCATTTTRREGISTLSRAIRPALIRSTSFRRNVTYTELPRTVDRGAYRSLRSIHYTADCTLTSAAIGERTARQRPSRASGTATWAPLYSANASVSWEPAEKLLVLLLDPPVQRPSVSHAH